MRHSSSNASRRFTKLNRFQSPRLGIEALEDRVVLSGDISFAAGVVTIEGTSLADTVTVDYIENLTSTWTDDEIRIRLTHNGHTHEEFFQANNGGTISTFELNVTKIVFDAFGSADRFTNNTSVPSDVDGGSGADSLIGGSGRDTMEGGTGNDSIRGGGSDDVIFGGDDNDTLRGGGGHDTLKGGDDNDKLFGNGGNDQLFGQRGSDTLSGSSGNDALYGGASPDSLTGGSGDDGLFGGSNTDTVSGGTGDDRFLSWKHSPGFFGMHDPDNIKDLNGNDARINFENGHTKTVNIEGTQTTYTGTEWTNSDIERLDAALAILHRETGNTKLLKTDWGFEITFERFSGNGRGFNSGGRITLSDDQFDNGDTWLRGYVLHEIGHNWDTENPNWNTFKTLSGWTESSSNPNANIFDRAGDGSNWFHLESADFASDYAKNNPYDDFSESFSAYFMMRAGWSWYNDGGGADAIPDKIELIDDWVDSL